MAVNPNAPESAIISRQGQCTQATGPSYTVLLFKTDQPGVLSFYCIRFRDPANRVRTNAHPLDYRDETYWKLHKDTQTIVNRLSRNPCSDSAKNHEKLLLTQSLVNSLVDRLAKPHSSNDTRPCEELALDLEALRLTQKHVRSLIERWSVSYGPLPAMESSSTKDPASIPQALLSTQALVERIVEKASESHPSDYWGSLVSSLAPLTSWAHTFFCSPAKESAFNQESMDSLLLTQGYVNSLVDKASESHPSCAKTAAEDLAPILKKQLLDQGYQMKCGDGSVSSDSLAMLTEVRGMSSEEEAVLQFDAIVRKSPTVKGP